MNPASQEIYPYDGPQRLVEFKPYSFAPHEGRKFLSQFTQSRARALAELGVEERVASVDQYLPTSQNFGLQDGVAGRDDELCRLWQKWTGESAPETTVTAELLEELIQVTVDRSVRLSGMSSEARWAREVITRLLQRFEVYGCVHAEYDREWRRVRSSPNRSDVIHRLALLGGWLAWLDAPLRRESSVAWLNATIKLLDLAVAGVRHGEWKLGADGRARMAAAIRLEGRLIDAWQVRSTGGAS